MQYRLSGVWALVALFSFAAACSDSAIDSQDEPGLALEAPQGQRITLELPRQPNRPQIQSTRVTLRNSGKATLKVTNLDFVGTPSRLYARKPGVAGVPVASCDACDSPICEPTGSGSLCVEVGLPELPFEIAPNERYDLTFYVSQSEAGSEELGCEAPSAGVPAQFASGYCGQLNIKTNARNSDTVVAEGAASVYFQSQGRQGVIELSDTFFEFAAVKPGTSEQRLFSVRNSGGQPLVLNGINVQDYGQFLSITPSAAGTSVPAGESREFTLALNVPATADAATLDFTTQIKVLSSATNIGNDTIVVRSSTGSGAAPLINIAPLTLKFPTSEQELTVKNEGTSTLQLTGLSFEPVSLRDFYTVEIDGAAPAYPVNVPKNTTKAIKITFARPAGRDADPVVGAMFLNHNDESNGKRTRITLLGDAGDVAIGELAPFVFSFSNKNSENQSRQFVVINRGTAPLTISDVVATAQMGSAVEFSVDGIKGQTIPAGGLGVGEVFFKSADGTPDQVSVTLSSDTQGEPMFLTLVSQDTSEAAPVAKIKASFSSQAKVGQIARFSASESTPASALPTAQWTLLSRPAGSDLIVQSNGVEVSFIPTVAGTYKLALTLSGALLDGQDVLEFEAVP
jgi:hypothetical protein